MKKKKIAPFLSYSKHVAKIKIIQKPHMKTPKPPTNKNRLRAGENGYFLDVFLQDQGVQMCSRVMVVSRGGSHAVPALGWGSCCLCGCGFLLLPGVWWHWGGVWTWTLQIAARPLALLPARAPQGRMGCYPGRAILSAFYKQEGWGEGFIFVWLIQDGLGACGGRGNSMSRRAPILCCLCPSCWAPGLAPRTSQGCFSAWECAAGTVGQCARCGSVAEGYWGLQILGSNPALPGSVGAEEQAPFLWLWTRADVACGFCCAASLCHHSARTLSSLAFPFFFPSLSLLARILTYITGW